MRVGYMQGVRDAELIQKRFPNEDLTMPGCAAGPYLEVRQVTRHFEFDSARDLFRRIRLAHSSEAAEHIAHHGLGSAPVCWMQTGYPAAIPVRFRRPRSFAKSSALDGCIPCRVAGQNAEEWGEDARNALTRLEWQSPAHRSPGAERHCNQTAAGDDRSVEALVQPGHRRVGELPARSLMVEKVADTRHVLLMGIRRWKEVFCSSFTAERQG